MYGSPVYTCRCCSIQLIVIIKTLSTEMRVFSDKTNLGGREFDGTSHFLAIHGKLSQKMNLL